MAIFNSYVSLPEGTKTAAFLGLETIVWVIPELPVDSDGPSDATHAAINPLAHGIFTKQLCHSVCNEV